MMDTNQLSVAFPTFTQTPLCGHPLTYTEVRTATSASTTYYSSSGQTYLDADANPTDMTNLDTIVTFDTTNELYTTTFDTSIASLDSHQYQGDYAINIQATTNGAPIELSNSDYGFILRIHNPCKYSSFTSSSSYTTNTQTAATITQISTTVLIPATTTFTEFTDAASSSYTTADDFTMCGARSYTYSPTSYSWLAFDIASKTFTATPTVAAEIGYAGVGGCYMITVSSTLTLYPVVPATTQILTICIEECIPTAFAPITVTSAQSYTIFDSMMTIPNSGYTQTPACDYNVVVTATIQKTTATVADVSDPVHASASSLTTASHIYASFI